jgi:predicted Zn finger-like uncharacterized protein
VTVRCPQCGTRYRLPPRSRLGRNPTYRCTRCRHVFAPDAEAEAPALEEPLDNDLPADDDVDDGPVFTIEPSPVEDVEDEDRDRRRAPSRRRDATAGLPPVPRTPVRFAARAVLVVALFYSVVSIYLYTHSAEARALFARIPLVGDDMAESRLHPGNIQLADVQGEFKRVHGDHLVFVISGTAINNAPVPVAGIQVQGTIWGAEEHRQVVYCGAAPQDLTELGVREIELVQTLKPSSEWLLRPGEQDRFVVAFIDPVLPVTEFGAEVVAVRGASGRQDGPLTARP